MQADKQTLINYAQFYASRGFPVFPVHAVINGRCSCRNSACPQKQRGKHPATRHGLKEATTDFEAIARFWSNVAYNIGIRTGGDAGLFVVDIDLSKGGLESFASIEAELPTTTKQLTGGGGFHLLYKMPQGLVGKNQNNIKRAADGKILHGIDTRGENGYIIAAPSNHHSGGVYEWSKSATPWEQLTEIPFDFLKKYNLTKHIEPESSLLFTPQTGTVTAATNSVPVPVTRAVTSNPATVPAPVTQTVTKPAQLSSDNLDDIRRALCYIEPEGRENWLRVGMALHSTHDARAFCLWDKWSQRTGANNYNASEQLKTWRGFDRSQRQRVERINIETLFHLANNNGYRPGDAAENLVFSNDLNTTSNASNTVTKNPPEQKHADLTPLESFSLADIEANPPPEVESLYLWNGATIAAGTVVFLAGAPKVGKSNLIIDFALSAAAGLPWLDKHFERPLKIYWMNAELRAPFVKQRIAPRLAAITCPKARVARAKKFPLYGKGKRR